MSAREPDPSLQCLERTVDVVDEGILKESRRIFARTTTIKEEGNALSDLLRHVLMVASVGLPILISAARAAARDAKAATFSERVAPALALATSR